AVDRLLAGESPTGVVRELGIRRKFLYQCWNQGWGTLAQAVTEERAAESGSTGETAPDGEVSGGRPQRRLTACGVKVSKA
ncbi:MAG: hypothetical protein WAN65_11730, partial [Candidatus Sulfotelmatobacter sp.]